MEISRTTTINYPREELFHYLCDPNNDPDWCPTVHSSELTTGQRGEAGAVYDQMHKPGPFPPSALEVTLHEVDHPDRIQLKSVDDVATFVVTYQLEDLGDGRTRVTQHDDIGFRGFGWLLAPFMALAVKAGIKRQFEELESKAMEGSISPAR